jgi:hypothetical protein
MKELLSGITGSVNNIIKKVFLDKNEAAQFAYEISIMATRSHACASLQTCVVLHVVTQLFAGEGCGSIKVLHRLGVGLG